MGKLRFLCYPINRNKHFLFLLFCFGSGLLLVEEGRCIYNLRVFKGRTLMIEMGDHDEAFSIFMDFPACSGRVCS